MRRAQPLEPGSELPWACSQAQSRPGPRPRPACSPSKVRDQDAGAGPSPCKRPVNYICYIIMCSYIRLQSTLTYNISFRITTSLLHSCNNASNYLTMSHHCNRHAHTGGSKS